MARRLLSWAMPGIVFVSAYGLSGIASLAFGSAPDEKQGPTTREMITPVTIDTHLHGCPKVAFNSLGRFLKDRGVNITNNTAGSAGFLYKNARDTFGVPPFDSRAGETSFHTTASATKLFDIFVQAAPEIIANIGDGAKAPACVLNGTSTPMFTGNQCESQAVSCLLGRPATTADVQLCNAVLAEAVLSDPADVTKKQHIAVATILAAGNTCE